MNADEKIWRYLKSAGLNDFGVAGLMGNLFAESGLNPKNLQNTYEKKLGMTDEEYTAAVDSGSYSQLCERQCRLRISSVDVLVTQGRSPCLL